MQQNLNIRFEKSVMIYYNNKLKYGKYSSQPTETRISLVSVRRKINKVYPKLKRERVNTKRTICSPIFWEADNSPPHLEYGGKKSEGEKKEKPNTSKRRKNSKE